MVEIIKSDKSWEEIAKDLEGLESNVTHESLDVKYDPVELEKELLTKEVTKDEDPKEIAMLGMQVYYPHFLRLIKEFHARELRTILKCVVEFPHHERHITEESSKLKEAVGILNFLMDAKMTLIASEAMENIEQKENANG